MQLNGHIIIKIGSRYEIRDAAYNLVAIQFSYRAALAFVSQR